MTKMGVYRFKNEYGLYLLLSQRVIDEVSVDTGVERNRIVNFLWLYYISKYILKSSYLRVYESLPYMKKLFLGGKPFTPKGFYLMLYDMRDKGLIIQVGKHFPIDFTMGRLISRFSRQFMERLQDFHESTATLKKDIFLVKRKDGRRKRRFVTKRKYTKKVSVEELKQ